MHNITLFQQKLKTHLFMLAFPTILYLNFYYTGTFEWFTGKCASQCCVIINIIRLKKLATNHFPQKVKERTSFDKLLSFTHKIGGHVFISDELLETKE